MLYSYNWQYPQAERPKNKQGQDMTDEELRVTAWMIVSDKPEALDWHTVGWERRRGWVQTPKPAQPYPSWVRNKELTDWEAPISRPNDGKLYEWNEDTQNWIEVTQ